MFGLTGPSPVSRNVQGNLPLLSSDICDASPSQELLGHPDLQDMDPMNRVDMLLFTEWVEEAREKLLKHVQVRTPPLYFLWMLTVGFMQPHSPSGDQ